MRAFEFISPEQQAYETGAYRKAAGLEYKNPWHPVHQKIMHDAYRDGYHEAEFDPELAALERLEDWPSENLDETSIAWRRGKGKPKQQFRCSSGPRAGRVVSDIRQCGEHPNPAKAAAMKVTRAKTKVKQARKAKRTKRVNPVSKMIQRMNKLRKK